MKKMRRTAVRTKMMKKRIRIRDLCALSKDNHRHRLVEYTRRVETCLGCDCLQNCTLLPVCARVG